MGMLIVGLVYYHFGGIALPWNVDVVLTSCIFFFGGYWFKMYYGKIREHINRNKSIVLFVVMGIINVCLGYLGVKIAGNGLEMFNATYGFPPFTLLSAFAGIFLIVIFSHWFNLSAIKYIGRNSLIYYAWHQTIMIPIVRAAFQYIGIPTETIADTFALMGERIAELIIIVGLSTICHICISKTRLKFMVGDWKKGVLKNGYNDCPSV
jgi:hypothetical protein